jgi:transketolase
MAELNELDGIRAGCARTLLGLYKKAGAGHIGASLSCLEILIYLFFYKMGGEDKFILSKGHAAAALYTVLAGAGKIPAEQLETFYRDGTLLAAHPPCSGKISAIPFGTGSLGHGLSLAAGIALSCAFTGSNFDVYCVVSEGDLNEGSTWEALLFASQHKLKNLTVIVDNNGLQGFGRSSEVMNLEPLADKFRSFGFAVETALNGNNFESINAAFNGGAFVKRDSPGCVIARTVKGSGVSFMENRLEWHYLSMTDEQYKKADGETGRGNA